MGRLPVIFAGHGSPMNAIADNSVTRMLRGLGEKIPQPKAVLCISAHWMTEGSWVTAMEKPKTIHDFYGFPQELFEVQYPAKGSPEMARHLSTVLTDPQVHEDKEMWGLDHGAWSVLKHMYPRADIPVLQLSLYLEQPAHYHYKLGKALSSLRDEGVLIVGSGNVVHNLRQIRWEENAPPHEWAVEHDEWIKNKIVTRDHESLIWDYNKGRSAELSIPTNEHYLPLLYVLAASDEKDKLTFTFEEIHNASISMRTLVFGD